MQRLLKAYSIILILTPFVYYGLLVYIHTIQKLILIRDFGSDDRMLSVPVFEITAIFMLVVSLLFFKWVSFLKRMVGSSLTTMIKAQIIFIGIFPVLLYLILVGFLLFKGVDLTIKYLFL